MLHPKLLLFAAFVIAGAVSPPTQEQSIHPSNQYWALRFQAGTAPQAVWVPATEAPVSPPITLEAWVYVEQAPGGALILGRTDRNLVVRRYGLVAQSDRFELVVSDGPQQRVVTAPIGLGRWIHVAGVIEASTLHLYVDGALAATGSHTGMAPFANDDRIHVGAAFPGAVAHARIWGARLAAAQLNRPVEAGSPALFGAWPLDDGFFSRIARDSSGASRHLTNGNPPEESSADAHWVPRESIEGQPYFRVRAFSAPRPLWNNGAVVDLDGDGDADYVRSGTVPFERWRNDPPYWDGEMPAPMSAYRNDGHGNFTDVTAPVFPQPIQLVGPYRHVVADFDGDGLDDIRFADIGPDGLPNPHPDQYPWPGEKQTLIMQTGAGHLVSERHRLPDTYLYMHHQAAGDIDGDGDIDLLSGWGHDSIPKWGEPPDHQLGFWINDGRGFFTDDQSRLPEDARNRSITAALLVDVDNDGDLDLYTGSAGDPIPTHDRLYLNEGNGRFLEAPAGAIPPRHQPGHTLLMMKAADFDGDGWIDLAQTAVEPLGDEMSSVQLLLNNRDGTFRDASNRLPADLRVVRFGGFDSIFPVDVNGNGRIDLMVSLGPNRPRIYINRGNAIFERMPELLGVRTGAYMIPADVDNDGDVDFIYDDGTDVLRVVENIRPWNGMPPQPRRRSVSHR